jgi:hypothetical protein
VNNNFLIWKPSLFCDYTDNGNATDLKNYYYTFTYKYNGVPPSFTDSYSVISYHESSSRVTLSQLTQGGDREMLLASARS